MLLTLENPWLFFQIDLPSGYWSLFSRNHSESAVENTRVRAHYRLGDRVVHWEGNLAAIGSRDVLLRESPHGMLQILKLGNVGDATGLDMSLEFAMPKERPFFLWRLVARNSSSLSIHFDRVDMLKAGPAPSATAHLLGRIHEAFRESKTRGAQSTIRLHSNFGDSAFFTNGWQSWSYAGALSHKDRHPNTRLGPFTLPLNNSRGTPRPVRTGQFASDMFGVLADRSHRIGLLAGFLSQLHQFGSIEALAGSGALALKMWSNCDGVLLESGDSIETDWAALQFVNLDDSDPIGAYLVAAGVEAKARVPSISETPVGWCSWYHYLNRVTEADMMANLDAAKKERHTTPFSVLQLDDGFEADVGDWFERNVKFPHDLKWLAGRIHEGGFTPGLWLAPFAVKPTATLHSEHPEWILRRGNGRPVNAGFVFDSWCHALDVSHPAVLTWLQQLVRTAVKDWGFPYLKLDFIYMGALFGSRFDPHFTRAQVIRTALTSIREAAGPDTFLLGCGCPLGSGIGIFDGMRISADVDTHWLPHYRGRSFFLAGEPDMASARNAIRNTITRAPLHRHWWINDPDCLLARDTDTRLSTAEVTSLASVIALSGGMVLLSDDMTSLPPQRRRVLQSLLPVVGRAARAIDWMDAAIPSKLVLSMSGAVGEWRVIGLFNWNEKARALRLSPEDLHIDVKGGCHVLDFWNQKYYRLGSGSLDFEQIPAHSSVLLAVREVAKEGAQWIGSDLHFTQGIEVKEWTEEASIVRFKLELGREADGWVWLQLPQPPSHVEVDGAAVQALRILERIYRVPVRVINQANVVVTI